MTTQNSNITMIQDFIFIVVNSDTQHMHPGWTETRGSPYSERGSTNHEINLIMIEALKEMGKITS